MCVAAYHKKGTSIKEEYLLNAWNNNHDGAGVMFFNGERLRWGKTLRSFDDLMKMYEIALRENTTGVVVHFRRASVGDITVENAHPFVYKDIGFVHNGTIYNIHAEKDKSDTRVFGNSVIAKLGHLVFTNPAITELIRGYIGRSKLILMSGKTGEVEIINPHLGEVNDGIWYSNHEYRMLKNRFNLDYGYCEMCDCRLFGKLEQLRNICNGCYNS